MFDTSECTPRSVIEAARLLPLPVRELHRAILQRFCIAAQVHRDELSESAATLGVDLADGLGQLAASDLVHVGSDGNIDVAYPFSGRSTNHTVRLDGGGPVSAMCAIDALGIPLMTGRKATIESHDPHDGTPIHISYTDGQWIWEPVTAVVLAASTEGCGTLVDTLCHSITFHANHTNAGAFLRTRPDLQGTVLDQVSATALSQYVFGALLAD